MTRRVPRPTGRISLLCAAACALALAACRAPSAPPPGIVVYQSDFGTGDGAVSAMKGVARGVEPRLVLEDLTHAIRPFDVWEGAYRLRQAAPYWPAGTVFVSVVDPGVGTERRSVVARTKEGRLFVTPDNGTLTLVDELLGIDAVREIDARLRVPESERSTTFHGRDVYSLTGALLAAGRLAFEDVGPDVPVASLVRISHARATLERAGDRACLVGTIPVLDPAFGNVWTDIPRALVDGHVALGARLSVTILHGGIEVFHGVMPYVSTFGDVPEGAPLAYLNSLGDLAFALNRGSFAAEHGIEAGRDWSVRVGLDASR